MAFARLPIRAGEARRVVFSVPAGRLGFTGRNGCFVVEPGTFTVFVGASSADVRASATTDLTGPAAYPERNAVPPFRYAVQRVA